MSAHLKVGDYFSIPLPDRRFAYCQLVHRNEELGYLIRVFDRITSLQLQAASDLQGAGLLFPPVFVGLRASVRSGRWKRIGNAAVHHFTHPKFRETMGTKPGRYHDWRIWDGEQTVKIGDLPTHMRSLELKSVWGDEALENRIVSGTYRGETML
jgi:hypothetical protein